MPSVHAHGYAENRRPDSPPTSTYFPSSIQFFGSENGIQNTCALWNSRDGSKLYLLAWFPQRARVVARSPTAPG